MGLFDDKGNLNEQFASQVYGQAAGQVTGAMPPGIPILGAGIELESVEAASEEMIRELEMQIGPPLKQGIDPNTPVMLGLVQCAQILNLIKALMAELAANETMTEDEKAYFEAGFDVVVDTDIVKSEE